MASPLLRRPARVLAVGVAAALAGTLLTPTLGHAEPSKSIPEVQREVETLHHKAEQATERYNIAQDQRDDVTRRLGEVRRSVATQQARLSELQRVAGRYAASTYRRGGLDAHLELLLADDPQEFLRRASSLEEVARRRGVAMRKAAAVQAQLVQDRLTVAQELARLERTRATLAAEKESVEKTLEAAERALDQLRAEDRARLEAARRAAVERATRDGRAAARAYAASSRGTTDSDSASDSGSSSRSGGGSGSGSGPAPSGGAAAALAFAYAQVGEPYVYGAAGPSSWDCSGLTMMAWRAGGKSLSRSSAAQMGDGTRVSRSALRPGDLVFYYSPVSHVAIYAGGGKIVHSTHPGDVVSVDPVDSMPFAGAVRP